MPDKRRVNVRGIITQGNTLFCVKHKQKDGSAAGFWCIPGGGVEDNEPVETALRREIIEETGITPVINRLLFIQQFPSSRPDRREELEFFFLIENSQDFTAINPAATSHGQAEIAQYAFINPAAENVLPDFLKTVDLALAAATQSPVQWFTYFK